MSHSLKKLEHNLAEMHIEVSAEDFKKAMELAYKRNKTRFTVPGFRKGKAPMQLVLNHYGESVLYDEAVDIAAFPAYQEALKEENIEPFSSPKISVSEVSMEKGMAMDCQFALRPEFKLGKYKGLVVYKPEVSISEQAVDDEIEKRRQKMARMVPLEEGTVQEADLVKIDFKGFLDGKPFAGGEGKNHSLKIGSKSFIPGFEEALIGFKKGEEKDIQVRFPEDYQAEALKGKDATFTVKVNDIHRQEIPALDDELVRDLSEEADNLEEFRAEVRKDLEKVASNEADEIFRDQAVEALIESSECDLPDMAVEDSVKFSIRQMEESYRQHGFSLEQMLQFSGIKPEEFLAQRRHLEKKMMLGRLGLDAIVEAEGYKKEDLDMQAFYTEKIQKMEPELQSESLLAEKVKDFEGKRSEEEKEEDANEALRHKAFKCLLDNAEITHEKPEEKKAVEDEVVAVKKTSKTTAKKAAKKETKTKAKAKSTSKSEAKDKEDKAQEDKE